MNKRDPIIPLPPPKISRQSSTIVRQEINSVFLESPQALTISPKKPKDSGYQILSKRHKKTYSKCQMLLSNISDLGQTLPLSDACEFFEQINISIC